MDPGSRYHNTANFWGLQSLSLSVEPTRWFLPAQISRNLELPMLEHFELSSSLLVESDHIKIIACWNLPGLKRLTITFFGMPWVLFTEPLNLLLSKHGRTVEELQVAYNCTRTNNEPPEPLDLTPLCPNLRHLVLHWEQWQRMSHHNVHWVDIWLPWLPTNLDTIARWQTLQHELVQSKMFPSLLGTRMLDIQLTSSKNVPFDLPPYSVQDQSDAFEINFMGYTIHQDEGMIRGSWLWDDASDDSDYESDSESPSESSSEEDSSDSDNESTFFEAGSDIEQEESFFPLM
ncbi:hypothetical protein BKA70DRAFT_1217569 [Coprinopsis sp. MPI-PUGE-AT-0042]|nr:hypothetical protein BKA70DRAFT_1217569 [Coprinopsis sp. MPI-PUGE-AT-0042]